MKFSSFCVTAFVCLLVGLLQWPHDAAAKATYGNSDDDVELEAILGERDTWPMDEMERDGTRMEVKRQFAAAAAGAAVTALWKKKGRRRRSLDLMERNEINGVSQTSALDVVAETLQSVQDQANTEKFLQSNTLKDLDQLLQEKVVKAEVYEIPARAGNEWFKNKHDGVVVTLGNGRQLLVVKGYEFFRGSPIAVLDARVMSDTWKLIESKEVQSSTLADYVKATELSYNSRHAAAKSIAME